MLLGRGVKEKGKEKRKSLKSNWLFGFIDKNIDFGWNTLNISQTTIVTKSG